MLTDTASCLVRILVASFCSKRKMGKLATFSKRYFSITEFPKILPELGGENPIRYHCIIDWILTSCMTVVVLPYITSLIFRYFNHKFYGSLITREVLLGRVPLYEVFLVLFIDPVLSSSKTERRQLETFPNFRKENGLYYGRFCWPTVPRTVFDDGPSIYSS